MVEFLRSDIVPDILLMAMGVCSVALVVVVSIFGFRELKKWVKSHNADMED
jgi:hypothetical protein